MVLKDFIMPIRLPTASLDARISCNRPARIRLASKTPACSTAASHGHSAILESKQTKAANAWLIVGQGLAGSCLAWQFLLRGIPFRIVDRGHGGSTRVAAGMINPITGKNFEPSWRIDEFHPEAISFYLELESILGVALWHPLPILRLASNGKEWNKIQGKLDSPSTRPWIKSSTPEIPSGFHAAVELLGGGWLDTPTFVNASRDHFIKKGCYDESFHDVSAPHPNRILCEGAHGLMNDQLGSHRCAKGEILTVRADWPETHIRIGAGGWLVPIGNQHFRIGSTYEWNQLDELPTAPGRDRICRLAEKLGGTDFEITSHVAGIRPILRRSQPLIGTNRAGDWIFNALGSKGSLYAPEMANMLADWIIGGIPPEEDFILPPV